MNLGNWQLDTASGGRFRLDGGAMFGVVPKPLWSKETPADSQNRIQLATNCVLARNGEQTVLVDTGYGGKLSSKEQAQMELDEGEPLLASLAALGVAADQIDWVVLSHLHFDHAGGSTRRLPDGRIVPTFPRATYVVNRLEWEDATAGAAELRGSYPLENLLPLAEANQVRWVNGEEELFSGLRVRHTGGHTRGHQVIRFESLGQSATYLGDLCPTHAHLPVFWCMGYDTHLLETRRQKLLVLGGIVDEEAIILWDHDPAMAAARIVRDQRRDFSVSQSWATL